jgi:hypothetical protein
MARWTEERERWMGGNEPYHRQGERRFRPEQEEAGMRGRGWRGEDRPGGWRDEDRFGEWRGGERRGEWHGDDRRGEWRGSERRQAWGERGSEPFHRDEEHGGDWRDEWRTGGPPREWYGSPQPGEYSTYGASQGAFPYGRSEYPTSFGRDYDYAGGYGHEGRYRGAPSGREEEAGPLERMGRKLKEGMRKLTGKGPKGYRRSDERVRDEVAERIARSGIDAEHVEIRVENGEVTLSGFVERREDKRDLEDLADDVFGVEEVQNHLRLRRGEQSRQGTAPTAGVGTGTTGTGAAMSARQSTARAGQERGEHPTGKH